MVYAEHYIHIIIACMLWCGNHKYIYIYIYMKSSRCSHVISTGSWLTLHRRHSSDNGSVSLKRKTSYYYIHIVCRYTSIHCSHILCWYLNRKSAEHPNWERRLIHHNDKKIIIMLSTGWWYDLIDLTVGKNRVYNIDVDKSAGYTKLSKSSANPNNLFECKTKLNIINYIVMVCVVWIYWIIAI